MFKMFNKIAIFVFGITIIIVGMFIGCCGFFFTRNIILEEDEDDEPLIP